MESERHARAHWVISAAAFVGAAAFIIFAVALILQAVSGHGGGPGNILRVGLAITSFFIGLFVASVGAMYWMSSHKAHHNESN